MVFFNFENRGKFFFSEFPLPPLSREQWPTSGVSLWRVLKKRTKFAAAIAMRGERAGSRDSGMRVSRFVIEIIDICMTKLLSCSDAYTLYSRVIAPVELLSKTNSPRKPRWKLSRRAKRKGRVFVPRECCDEPFLRLHLRHRCTTCFADDSSLRSVCVTSVIGVIAHSPRAKQRFALIVGCSDFTTFKWKASELSMGSCKIANDKAGLWGHSRTPQKPALIDQVWKWRFVKLAFAMELSELDFLGWKLSWNFNCETVHFVVANYLE